MKKINHNYNNQNTNKILGEINHKGFISMGLLSLTYKEFLQISKKMPTVQ